MIAALIVAVLALSMAVAYEAYMRRQDLRIYRSLLVDEGVKRAIVTRQLQHHAIALEAATANTEAALMFLTWRLACRGVLNGDDAPVDSSATTIN